MCSVAVQHSHNIANLGENRGDPVFETAVVLVRNDQVSDSVEALLAKLFALKREVSHVMRIEALHDVFLNAAARGNSAVNQLVLEDVAQHLAVSAGNHVRSEAKEDRALGVRPHRWILEVICVSFLPLAVTQSPLQHLVDLLDRKT